ncbi:hypothetical protein E2C01_032026 [Portunus trituberculatus]|uniref:Uncharacterized protein n=1 Tax=Portunus trituberculatus TaxID=210409 RepID=A0A5B7EZT2_PORTR|nr:hypothetical protein [Portunus trituberculatus]
MVVFILGSLLQLLPLQIRPIQYLSQVGPFILKDPAVIVPWDIGDLVREIAEMLLQVGACLHWQWQEYEKIRTGEWVIKTLCYNYILPFLRGPLLSGSPVEFLTY